MQSCNFTSALADGIQIEKRLGRMFVCAVAGVDYACSQPIRQKLRRARRTVAQHEDIGVQRLEVARSVFERFAFGQAGGGCRDIDHVRAQTKRGQLK